MVLLPYGGAAQASCIVSKQQNDVHAPNHCQYMRLAWLCAVSLKRNTDIVEWQFYLNGNTCIDLAACETVK